MNAPALKIASAPQTQQTAPPAPHAAQTTSKRTSPIRRIILGAVLLTALGTAAYYIYGWFTLGRFQVSTDDAYVQTDLSQLGAKIAGYVVEIPATENSAVKTGDVIVKLDDGDYKLALASAEARIETQNAAIATIAQQITAQQSQINSALAQLDSAKAAEINAVLSQNRASQLVKSNAGSQQALEDATRTRASAVANVSVANANIDSARAQIGILNAKSAEAQSSLSELGIARDKAKRDLSFTEIKAPFDGTVGNRAVQVGQYVGPGTRLMALVPKNASYIEANFKETQLGNIHEGQKVVITVDALNGETYEGKVESISPASGAEFSLLPPENATGNFTKITQRLPVKITVSPELSAKLRLGLSVTVAVDLRDDGTSR
jgi:membrane fusion protein, multidrug efflux system